MTTGLLAANPNTGATLHHQGVGLVQKKHSTLLKSVIVSIEWLKRVCSLPPSALALADRVSYGAQGIKAIASAAATIPSIFKLCESVTDLTHTINKNNSSDEWVTAETVKSVATNFFTSSGDIAYLAVAAHRFHLISISRAVPGLQVYASVVFTLTAIQRISSTWCNKSLEMIDKMLHTMKEVSSVALGALGIVALTTGSAALATVMLVASTAWIAADLALYARTPTEEPEISIEELEQIFA